MCPEPLGIFPSLKLLEMYEVRLESARKGCLLLNVTHSGWGESGGRGCSMGSCTGATAEPRHHVEGVSDTEAARHPSVYLLPKSSRKESGKSHT